MYVYALPLDIDGAHEDFCLHTEQGADHCRRQSVLACAGFGDELGFAHVFCEQTLAERVVHLVSAAVHEVFALDIDLKAEMFAETPGVV